MGEAAAIREERFAGIAFNILAPRILDVLPCYRVFQFSGEKGNAVKKDPEVDALLAFTAEAQLANDGKEIRPVEAAGLFVESARGLEIGELEVDSCILDALPENAQRS